jgi:hypothetical protein
MPSNNEIEKTKKEIEVLTKKLSFLEELSQTKSPCEIAYKRLYGCYPMGEPFWIVFKKGYEAHQSLVDDANKIIAAASMTNCTLEGNPPNGCSAWSEWFELFGSNGILHNLRISAKEYQPKEKEQKWDVVRESVKWCEEHKNESVEDYLKPQTPDKIEENLREAFKKVQQTEEWKETQRKIDSNYDDMVKNPPEFLKFELGQSLTDLIYDWWEDVFTKNSNDDIENCIGRLVYWIEEWLPKSQSAAGSQNVDTELLVDGFNDCLTKIKSKLRNKK